MTVLNLARWASWAGVRGLVTDVGLERMQVMPFQVEPTIEPMEPEKGPKIPCLKIAIMINF